MQKDEGVVREFSRFETVEWLYDGLNGKIIPWTKANGGTSDDPSVQAFVVAVDGSVFSRSPDQTTYNAKGFADWLVKQASAFEKEHPRTRMPFVRAEVKIEDGKPVCAELDGAAGKAVLLYFGREETSEATKAEKKETAAARSFEKKTLDSKSAAEAAEGFVLLRFDLSDEAHRALAKEVGVKSAPYLLLRLPGEAGPVDLGARASASSLTYQLRKHRPKEE